VDIGFIVDSATNVFGIAVSYAFLQSIYDEDTGIMPWRVAPYGMDGSMIHCVMQVGVISILGLNELRLHSVSEICVCTNVRVLVIA